MSSLPRCAYSSIQSQRQLTGTYRLKNPHLKHRHNSSNKFIKTLMLNQSKSQKVIDKEGGTEGTDSVMDKKELKRYCINKFRGNGGQQQKIILKRKNSSLKLFKKDDTFKINQLHKMEQVRNQESIVAKKQKEKEDRWDKSFSRDTLSSQQTISVKRRVQILKMGRNCKSKLQIKDQNMGKKQNKGDVSFEDKLKQHHFEQQKILSTQKIRSQNVLGVGLKKCSSSKIKILVKNPFQRYLKQQEQPEPIPSSNRISIESIPQLKQSQIVQLDESNPSLEYRHDLQQLLAMM